VYRLSDLELASRLSFFLWRSLPDDELIDVAAKNQLRGNLDKQVRRLLADRRASRFIKDFSEQWLEVRNLQGLDPNAPAFDDSLRKAMMKETELFFESQVREDRPLPELLRADYTFLNEQLARHYGITNIYGSHFRRVTMTDERRQGLLGHASVLTVTSYADRTSVVLRGKWILENLPDRRRRRRHPMCRLSRRTTAAASRRRFASGWSSTATTPCARAVMPEWIRSASHSNTTMRSAAGARPTAAPPSTRRSRCTARRLRARRRSARRC
jgi:hypothetical protein